MRVALAHDYLTQRGGAERVAAILQRAFPDAPLYTSLYDRDRTYPEFAGTQIHTLALNKVSLLRRHHRLALPLLASAFSHCQIDADVVVCSSSGWAHGVQASGHKIVYCHAPARWLYQSARYAPRRTSPFSLAGRVARGALVRWDRRAAASADLYLANSTVSRRAIAEAYGIEAEIVPPPPGITPDGPETPVPGLDGGFFVCVSRLMPYKNVDVVVEAFRRLPDEQLVVVGSGPLNRNLRAIAGPNVRFIGAVSDAQLRWLYHAAQAVVAVAYEDYGLTPVEAAAWGKPAIVLRAGGYLDTVADGRSGVFVDTATPGAVVGGVRALHALALEPAAVTAHAAEFSTERFMARLRAVVAETAARATY